MVLFEETGTFGISCTIDHRYVHMNLNFALNSVQNEEKQRRNKGEKLTNMIFCSAQLLADPKLQGFGAEDHGQEISSLLTGQPRIAQNCQVSMGSNLVQEEFEVRTYFVHVRRLIYSMLPSIRTLQFKIAITFLC